MKPSQLIGVGLGLFSLFAFGLGMIIGQDASPTDNEVVSGVWSGTIAAEGGAAASGEIAFVIDTNGVVYNGGIRLTALEGVLSGDEHCSIQFTELTAETTPVHGSFAAPESAEGRYEITSCLVREQGYITLNPPVSGTWQAAPAAEEDLVAAVHIFARQPADVLASGAALFNLRCSGCHGFGGVGTEIAPPFIDFYALTYDYVEGRVRSGPEVMSAFTEEDLPNDQLADIVTYIEDELVQTGIREYTEEELAAGRDLYVEKCAECHGTRGQGTNDFGPPLLIWPPYSVTGIFEGARIPLPEMPRVRVSNDELDLIAGYYILELSTGE